MASGTVVLEGAGGIACAVGYPLVMQGLGAMHLTDPDVVQPSNLSRQLYKPEDVFKNKGHCLAQRLSEMGVLGTRLTGYPLYFSEFVELYGTIKADVVVSGVDNNAARLQACQWSRKIRKPLVCAGVGEKAEGAYCFVQEPGKACLGCYLGNALLQGGSPCPGTPAVIDVLHGVGGFMSYAVTSLLMPRPRSWNLVRFFMGSAEWKVAIIEPQKRCPVCQGAGA